MKKKFINILKIKTQLPLAIYLLEKDVERNKKAKISIRKYEKAKKINAEGYELVNFYKAISKF
ncbi:hypothetical protein GJU39_19950 [Pedobacter petrophilus]|uniref:Uncharacterized protein n=1 Tax=Pedobacter petrophilus TaxID=1908241 RepID=A0A7K0G3S6_9SPHI|nr:hypothetical protein [Pedobacter petrophilus]MRX78361.1 hypothetical protein [Pedobacter petrophilus]